MRCFANEESTFHVFEDCPHSREVCLCMGFASTTLLTCHDIQRWVLTITSYKPSLLIFATIWCLWKWCNNVVFSYENLGVQAVCAMIRQMNTDLDLYYFLMPV